MQRADAKLLRRFMRVDKKHSELQNVFKVAKRLFKELNTPFSHKLLEYLSKGDYNSIARASVDPRSYTSAESYYLDAIAASFLRKFEDLPSDIDTRKVAVDTFFSNEAMNATTNRRLEYLLGTGLKKPNHSSELDSFYVSEAAHLDADFIDIQGQSLKTSMLLDVITEAKRIIADALGQHPSDEELVRKGRFGPGSTSAVSGDTVNVFAKLIAIPECTPNALPLVMGLNSCEAWLSLLHETQPEYISVTSAVGPTRRRLKPKLVRGESFTTVVKNAETDRGISIPVHLDSFFQLAYGSILENRLNKIGLDKAVQQVLHGRLAQQASIDGVYCTVDKKSASDLNSYNLAKLLLPWEWFKGMSRVRSEECFIKTGNGDKGRWITLEKFSAMGNGFTFELETLIFYAVARACVNILKGEDAVKFLVSLFGDDAILPSDCYQLYCAVIQYLGHSINNKKSFVNCGFNESCGQDFFKGQNVRPFFLKEDPKHAVEWIKVANGLAIVDRRLRSITSDRRSIYNVIRRCVDNIPSSLRFYGPPSQDGGETRWIETDDYTKWQTRVREGRRVVRGILASGNYLQRSRFADDTLIVATLAGFTSKDDVIIDTDFPDTNLFESRRIALRGRPTEYRRKWFSTLESAPDGQQWPF